MCQRTLIPRDDALPYFLVRARHIANVPAQLHYTQMGQYTTLNWKCEVLSHIFH